MYFGFCCCLPQDDVHKMYTSIRGERFDLDSLADDLDAINRQLDYAEDELLGQYPGYVRFQPAEEPPKQDETKEEEEEEEATDVELSINKAAVATESSSSNATSSFSANCTDVTATPSTSLNLMKTRNQTYIKTPTSTKLAAFGTPREKSVPKAAAAAARPKLVFTPKQTPRRNTPARPVLPIAPPSSAKIAKRQHPWHNTMTAAHSSSSSSASTTDSAPKTPSAKSHPACLDSLYAKFDRWI